ELRAAPSGVAPPGAPGPGWLVPGRLPGGRLDLTPAELVAQFADWRSAPAPAGPGLVLVNRRELRQSNSMLRSGAAHPPLLMHPDDAARLGLTAGQSVRLSSTAGSTTAAVEPTNAIRPGVVSLPHGWAAPGVNELTSSTAGVDPLTGM